MEWQPIETAPKDGTPIWCYEDGDQFQACWSNEPGHYDGPHWEPLWLNIHGCGCCGDTYPKPTHWRHLMPKP